MSQKGRPAGRLVIRDKKSVRPDTHRPISSIRKMNLFLWAIFTFETDECYRFRSDLTKA